MFQTVQIGVFVKPAPGDAASVPIILKDGDKGEANLTVQITVTPDMTKADFLDAVKRAASRKNVAESFLETLAAGQTYTLVDVVSPAQQAKATYLRNQAKQQRLYQAGVAGNTAAATRASQMLATLISNFQDAFFD